MPAKKSSAKTDKPKKKPTRKNTTAKRATIKKTIKRKPASKKASVKKDIAKAVDAIPAVVATEFREAKKASKDHQDQYRQTLYKQKQTMLWTGVTALALLVVGMWVWNMVATINTVRANGPSSELTFLQAASQELRGTFDSFELIDPEETATPSIDPTTAVRASLEGMLHSDETNRLLNGNIATTQVTIVGSSTPETATTTTQIPTNVIE